MHYFAINGTAWRELTAVTLCFLYEIDILRLRTSFEYAKKR
jgi:hypothetical protein